MNAKKLVTIEEMNEVIAKSWTAAGLAGLVPAEEIDAWVASGGTENVRIEKGGRLTVAALFTSLFCVSVEPTIAQRRSSLHENPLA